METNKDKSTAFMFNENTNNKKFKTNVKDTKQAKADRKRDNKMQAKIAECN